MKKLDTVFVTGYSQAPKGTKLFENGALLGVMFEITRDTHFIIRADSTFVTEAARDYFNKMMVGFNFETDLEEMIKTVEANLFIPSTQSVIVAIKIAHQRYSDNMTKKTKKYLK